MRLDLPICKIECFDAVHGHLRVTLPGLCTAGVLVTQTPNWYSEKIDGSGKRFSGSRIILQGKPENSDRAESSSFSYTSDLEEQLRVPLQGHFRNSTCAIATAASLRLEPVLCFGLKPSSLSVSTIRGSTPRSPTKWRALSVKENLTVKPQHYTKILLCMTLDYGFWPHPHISWSDLPWSKEF